MRDPCHAADSTRRGSALLLVVLATAVLAALAFTLLSATGRDDAASTAAARSDDALAAADAATTLAIWHLAQDLARDRAGWSNRLLVIGDASLPEALRRGASFDATGDATGSPGTYYVDLGDTACGSTPCDSDDAWREAMGGPVDVPSLPWTENGPDSRPRYLSGAERCRVRILAFPRDPTRAVGALRADRIGILAEGGSDRVLGVGSRRGLRRVLATFRAKDVGPWGGALFASGTVRLTRSAVRGSVHVLDSGQAPVALRLAGGSRVLDSYSGADAAVVSRLRIPEPQALEAELRVRAGNVVLSAEDELGSPCATPADCGPTPDPPISSPGKGPLDALSLGRSSEIVGATENHWQDRWLPYDAPSMGDLEAPFVDLHGHGFGSYEAFLRGAPDGPGVHALSLAALDGASPLRLSRELAAAAREARSRIADDNTTDVPTPWASVSWGPGVTSDGPVDVLVDPAGTSPIVGVFRHLPAASEAPWSSCQFRRSGGGHGFLLIPETEGPPTSATLGPELVWDFIQRSFAHYDATLSEREGMAVLKAFLGKPADDPAPRLSPIGPSAHARLIVYGVVVTGGRALRIDVSDVDFLGRGTIAATRASEGAPDVVIDGVSILPARSFPTQDVLGLMAAGALEARGRRGAPRCRILAALYGASRVMLRGVAVGGAVASRDVACEDSEIDQALDLPEALPPFLVGSVHCYVIRQESWQEIDLAGS